MSRPTLQPLAELTAAQARRLTGVFCDIDDTLTHEGELVPEAFLALHRLRSAGLHVVPITGRPGGWVDHIARMWPVSGVVGENGGLFFYMHDGAMVRSYLQDPETRQRHRARLDALAASILEAGPGAPWPRIRPTGTSTSPSTSVRTWPPSTEMPSSASSMRSRRLERPARCPPFT